MTVWAMPPKEPQTLSFVIPGRLPGLNEVIRVGRGNRFGGAKQKQVAEAMICPYLPKPIPLDYPVVVGFTWFEPDKRRDPDNIAAAGAKFILDAMVAAKVLRGDSQRFIAGITHRVTTDRANPRVEVTIEGAS